MKKLSNGIEKNDINIYGNPQKSQRRFSDCYQRNALKLIKETPEADIKNIIREFLNIAYVNMGKDSIDNAPEKIVESIYFLLIEKYPFLPVNQFAKAILKGSIGEISEKTTTKLSPKNINHWLSEITMEYDENIRKKSHSNIFQEMQKTRPNEIPFGKAICKKIEWINTGKMHPNEWDKIDLKELALMIKEGLRDEDILKKYKS